MNTRVTTNQLIVKRVSRDDASEEWVDLDFAAEKVARYMNTNEDEVRDYLLGGGKTQTISFVYYIPKAHEALMAAYEEDKKNRPAQYTPIE